MNASQANPSHQAILASDHMIHNSQMILDDNMRGDKIDADASELSRRQEITGVTQRLFLKKLPDRLQNLRYGR